MKFKYKIGQYIKIRKLERFKQDKITKQFVGKIAKVISREKIKQLYWENTYENFYWIEFIDESIEKKHKEINTYIDNGIEIYEDAFCFEESEIKEIILKELNKIKEGKKI